MNNNHAIEYTGTYIHAKRYGGCEYRESLDFWTRVVEACKIHDCYDILCESYIKGATTSQMVDYSSIFPTAGMTIKHRFAYVCHEPEAMNDVKFIETYLKNRGLMNGQVFFNIEAALHWLLHSEKKAGVYS